MWTHAHTHVRTQQLSELRKDNFGLKLRIYHLEEALNTKWGERSEGWQLVSLTLPLFSPNNSLSLSPPPLSPGV